MLSEILQQRFDKHIEELIKIHESDLRRIKMLEATNKELSDEQFKDKELQRLQDEVEHWRHIACQGFTINDEELKLIRAWEGYHEHKDFYYKFVPTPIGDSGSVVCAVCGEEFEFKEVR